MDATTKITKNLGGDRLGSGSKNNISMHAYNRSTHDLSKAWRSSMNPGVLIPFCKFVSLPGDTWSIDLESLVRTVPSIGPMYGSFKLQLDMFEIPMRLYNGLLHNNMVNIGLNMDQVKIPKMELSTTMKNPFKYTYDVDNSQIASDSLLHYLGIKGIGDALFHSALDKDDTYVLERKFNAIPVLAYYDIYKNYYANKQEGKGVIIAPNPVGVTVTINSFGYMLNEISYSSEFPGALVNTYNRPVWHNMFLEAAEGSTLPTGVTIVGDTYQESARNYYLESEGDYRIDFSGAQNVLDMELVLTDSLNVTSAEKITDIFPSAHIEGNSYVLGMPAAAYVGNKVLGIGYVRTTDYGEENAIILKNFDLSEIDDARIKILQDTGLNNEFIINNLTGTPYITVTGVDSQGYALSRMHQNGLAIKTYQSDLLQNWLQTEWIDGVNGINQITAVDVSSGSFTIDSLNLANKVYNMLNRIAVSGGSYEDYLEAVYTVESNRRVESPVYKGGMSAEIMFQEVVSTSASEGDPLGSLAGKGGQHNQQGGHIEIRCDEPGYIMGIVSITPRVDYSQGNDWDMVELDTVNDLHKPALDGIGFEDLLQERMAWFGTQYDPQTQEWVKYAAGKVPAWMNYMTAVNETHGEFAEADKTMYMTLNRRYEYHDELQSGTTGIGDLTTYVDPTKYNYAFADTSLTAQNFWVQLGLKVESRRVMSAKILPNL